MAYLCKYCYQKFDSKKLMVLRNCSKSPSGKHAPAGTAIKGIYMLGILIGVIFGIVELFKYLKLTDKITAVFNLLGDKISGMIEIIGNLFK